MNKEEQVALLKQHEDDTRLIANLVIERQRFAGMVNSLANSILESSDKSDNLTLEAEEAIVEVLPYL